MVPCPVCETPNPPQARECGTCGKVFAALAVPDVAAGGLTELELGRLDSSAIPVVPDAMPELDLGRSAPVNAVADDRTPDLELGRAAPVNVIADATPDVERTHVAEKEWTPLSDGPVTCRACGVAQTDLTSVMCGNCGRKLPVVAAAQGVLLDAVPLQNPEDRVRCFSCGAKVYPSELCTDCGMPLRQASA